MSFFNPAGQTGHLLARVPAVVSGGRRVATRRHSHPHYLTAYQTQVITWTTAHATEDTLRSTTRAV